MLTAVKRFAAKNRGAQMRRAGGDLPGAGAMASVRVAAARAAGELRCGLRGAGAVATVETVVLGLS